MTEYYGQPKTGKPFPPDDTYFAWSPENQKGWWVTSRGVYHQFSHIKPTMSFTRQWLRVMPYELDSDLQMDEGL